MSVYRAHLPPPPPERPLDRLFRAIAIAAERGLAAPLFGGAELRASGVGLAALATTAPGSFFARSCDSVALARFRAGETDGVLLVVCGGNYKDEGCGLAASAVACAFLDALAAPLPAGVDVPPALRRTMLHAHDAVQAVSSEPISGLALDTVMRRRTDLRGIGTSVTAAAVMPDRVWTAHLGDGSAVLVREGRARRLTIAHTLANDPDFRGFPAAAKLDRLFAAQVVTRVLGFTEACPAFDVARADLRPGDRVVVGNLALEAEMAPGTGADDGAEGACRRLAREMAERFAMAPASVGVVDVLAGGGDEAADRRPS